MTHDYKRHGVTTLFAALDVLEGRVIGQCMKHHRHQDFIRFEKAVARSSSVAGPAVAADLARSPPRWFTSSTGWDTSLTAEFALLAPAGSIPPRLFHFADPRHCTIYYVTMPKMKNLTR